MINHSTVKDSNGRRGAKSGHDLEEEAAEAAREEEIETAPEAGQQGTSMAGTARQPGEGRGRSRGGRPGVAGYGDGRARRGGLAWRATATAIGECAEAAGRGGWAGLGWRGGGWSRGLGFIFRLGWSLASI